MGFETVALDDLGYGLTQVRPGFTQAYDDWVELTAAFIAHERATDSRPLVLYGLSAGGMLTYHVAARMPRGSLAGIIGMTFIDQRSQQVRDETAHDLVTARGGRAAHGRTRQDPARVGAVPDEPGLEDVGTRQRPRCHDGLHGGPHVGGELGAGPVPGPLLALRAGY